MMLNTASMRMLIHPTTTACTLFPLKQAASRHSQCKLHCSIIVQCSGHCASNPSAVCAGSSRLRSYMDDWPTFCSSARWIRWIRDRLPCLCSGAWVRRPLLIKVEAVGSCWTRRFERDSVPLWRSCALYVARSARNLLAATNFVTCGAHVPPHVLLQFAGKACVLYAQWDL